MPTHPGLTGADLHIDSGKKASITVAGSTYTMDGTKQILYCDTASTGADIDVTLPNPATFVDILFEIKNIASAHQIIMHQFGFENIDGSGATFAIDVLGSRSAPDAIQIRSDGTNWWIFGHSHTF